VITEACCVICGATEEEAVLHSQTVCEHCAHRVVLVGSGIPLLGADAPLLGRPRSPKWHTLAKHTLDEHPDCIVCGGPADCVHHLIPVHVAIAIGRPELELDPANLRSICNRLGCHFIVAHLRRWDRVNLRLDDDAAYLRERQESCDQELRAYLDSRDA
jgi:hypothetical protein